MTIHAARYRQGYSIGAGAVVLAHERVLLVQLGYGPHTQAWAIPGGYVEPGETIDVAIRREILEETGVTAEVLGLIAMRSRVTPDDNSAYCIFLMRASHEEVHADGVEVLDARFFSRQEAQALSDVTPLSRILITRAFAGELRVLERYPVPSYPTSEFVLFL
jgi:ADP-ribose pyrophosphatase YjhB (NUDIX family)